MTPTGHGAVGHTDAVSSLPPARHLLRARDLADRRFAEPLTVADMANAAHLSTAHFGPRVPAHVRRVTASVPAGPRRLERAAALLRTTDWVVARICIAVGMQSQATFTTSFRTHFGESRSRTGPSTRLRLRWRWCRCAYTRVRAAPIPHDSRRQRRRW